MRLSILSFHIFLLQCTYTTGTVEINMRLIILLTFICFFAAGKFTEEESSSPLTDISSYTQTTFSTYIDHYSPMPNKFSMKYYYKTTYWNQTGPIFFFCGGEGRIEVFLNSTGWVDALAEQMNAIVVYAEHRYFGSSLPFGNKSYTKNSYTKYLSPHQAMADFAYLLSSLRGQYNNSKVITFGGGYSGMISAWMRIKYANVVDGAVASSAPVNHFYGTVDPTEFYHIVTNDYQAVEPSCPAYIRTAYDYITNMTDYPTTYFNLTMLYQTCYPIITPSDMFKLKKWIQYAMTFMAISNYPYKSNFYNPLPAYPVTQACNMFNDVEIDDIWAVLKAVKDAANIYFNYSGTLECNDLNNFVQGNFGPGNGLDYLSCTYLNVPLGSNATNSMFGNIPWDQTWWNSYCVSTWGRSPILNYATVYFGATTDSQTKWYLRDATNIIFSNGSLDPWISGAITKSINPTVLGFVMAGGAHIADLKAPNVNDPAEVTNGRAIIKGAIQYALSEKIPE